MIEIINEIRKGKYTKSIILVVIIATYAMAFTTIVYNNDGILYLPMNGFFSPTSNGRFSLEPLQNILYANFSLYILNLIIAIGSLLVAGKYILKIFNLNKEHQKILIYTTILTFPLMSFFLGYGTKFSLYCIGMAIMIMSLYYILKEDIKSNIIGVGLIIFSLSIYQVFISILMGLFILYYLIKNSEMKINISEIMKKISLIVLAMIIYYGIESIIFIIFNVENDRFDFYQAIINLPINILDTYKYFWTFISGNALYFNYHHGTEIIIIMSLFTYIYVFLIKGENKLKALILLILFIPSIYSIYIITSLTPIGDFSSYYFNFGILAFFLGVIIISDKINNKKISSIIIMLLVVMVYNNIVLYNVSTVQEVNITKNTERFISKISFDLAATKDYTKDSKVNFKGTIAKNDNFKFHQEGMFNIRKANYIFPVALTKDKDQDLRINSLLQFYGLKINYEPFNETESIDEQKFNDAPSFPKKGYIYKDNGTFIVKIGEKLQ